MRDEARDQAAEDYLTSLHDADWYIGDATRADWKRAYAHVDAPPTAPADSEGEA